MNGTTREDLELAWQAYRYIADEMTADEARLFEERLDAEQRVREAVARMVGLAAAVRALPAETFQPRVRLPRAFAPVGWVSLGVAACLVVMFGLQSIGKLSRDRGGETAGSPQDRQVALVWIPAEQDANADDEAFASATSDVEESGEVETPSWLTAAVTYEGDLPMPIQESEVN